jgi:NTP pyrophosphatase (non-canonical NTP hydrolase)
MRGTKMTFKELQERALAVRQQYSDMEIANYGRAWTNEELALGFGKDVGDLMKLVVAKEGMREVEDVDSKLAHELSDCLWSVIVLADKCGVDLESSFTKTMDELEVRIQKEKKNGRSRE